jgi:RecB family exonuclease
MKMVIQRLIAIGSDKGFSPSALNTYLSCSLQFYYQNLLKLREKDLPEETMEDNTFGMVVHGALELLYTPWVGKTLTAKDIEGLVEQRRSGC